MLWYTAGLSRYEVYSESVSTSLLWVCEQRRLMNLRKMLNLRRAFTVCICDIKVPKSHPGISCNGPFIFCLISLETFLKMQPMVNQLNLCLYLHPYFVHVSRQCSVEIVHLHMLAQAFTARICYKSQNPM